MLINQTQPKKRPSHNQYQNLADLLSPSSLSASPTVGLQPSTQSGHPHQRSHRTEYDREFLMNSIDPEPQPLAINAQTTPQSGLENSGIAPQKLYLGLSFWAIIIALSISSILTALNNTAVTTLLPVIV